MAKVSGVILSLRTSKILTGQASLLLPLIAHPTLWNRSVSSTLSTSLSSSLGASLPYACSACTEEVSLYSLTFRCQDVSLLSWDTGHVADNPVEAWYVPQAMQQC